jgi:hypothetical protein
MFLRNAVEILQTFCDALNRNISFLVQYKTHQGITRFGCLATAAAARASRKMRAILDCISKIRNRPLYNCLKICIEPKKKPPNLWGGYPSTPILIRRKTEQNVWKSMGCKIFDFLRKSVERPPTSISCPANGQVVVSDTGSVQHSNYDYISLCSLHSGPLSFTATIFQK